MLVWLTDGDIAKKKYPTTTSLTRLLWTIHRPQFILDLFSTKVRVNTETRIGGFYEKARCLLCFIIIRQHCELHTHNSIFWGRGRNLAAKYAKFSERTNPKLSAWLNTNRRKWENMLNVLLFGGKLALQGSQSDQTASDGSSCPHQRQGRRPLLFFLQLPLFSCSLTTIPPSPSLALFWCTRMSEIRPCI